MDYSDFSSDSKLEEVLAPGAPFVAWWVKNLPAMQEKRLRFLGREMPWRRKWQPTPVFLPGESHGQRSLEGSGQWRQKELDMTERLSMHTRVNWLLS